MNNDLDFTIFLEYGFRFIPLWPAQYNPEEDRYLCQCPRKSYCTSPGKHPINKDWQDTPPPINSPDLELLIRNSKCNFAIATGSQVNDSAERLVVIDIDLPGMSDPLIALLPDTVTVRTRSGGLHFYYFAPLSLPIKNLSTGYIDVRSDGGYVLAPPTKGYDFTPDSFTTITHLTTLPPIPRREPTQRDLSTSSYTPYGTYDGKVPCGERDAYVFHELITLTNAGLSLNQLLTHCDHIYRSLEQPNHDKYTLGAIRDKARYVYDRYSDPDTQSLREAMDLYFPPNT